MSEEKIQLKSSDRDAKTTNTKTIRKQGLIPAVIYGHNKATASLTVNALEFEKVLKKAGESTIIELITADGKTHPVLIHDVQHHYLTTRPIHADFYEVSMTEKLTAQVTLDFTGEAKSVKELGGVLVKVLTEVEVECLPVDLPHSINVDLSKLVTFHDTILVENLVVSSKVKILNTPDEMVAKVQPPREVEAEPTTAPIEDVSAVIGAAENKPEEEGKDKAKDSKK